jgi:hypothetical protein
MPSIHELADAYRVNYATFEKIDKRLQEMKQAISEAAAALSTPRSAHIPNMGLTFPLASSSPATIALNRWPTSEELGKTLSEWHHAHHKLEQGWRALKQDPNMKPADLRRPPYLPR